MSRRVVLVVGGLAAILAIGLYVRHRGQASAQASQAADARAAADRVVPVRTAAVVQGEVPVFLEGLGSATAYESVIVRSQVDGRLEKVLFTEGQAVKKGEVLAQ